MVFDTIIIGGGPSGLSAALYLLRAQKSVLVIEKEAFGGQLATSPLVENYPGFKEITGLELSSKMFDQVLNLGCQFDIDEVVSLTKSDTFKLKTKFKSYEAKSVIIANGLIHKSLGLEKEEELIGHGISYCALCDGAFYKDQDVIVIGDANTALQNALLLASSAKHVYIYTLFDRFLGDLALVERAKTNDKISYFHNFSLLKYLVTNDKISGVVFENTKTKEIKEVPIEGVFIAIGQSPNNELFNELVELDSKGFINTNTNLETKTPGLFASGDTRNNDNKQVIVATSEGAIAAIGVLKFLEANNL